MAPLIFHAGLHKTGSSLLQASVFPRLEGVQYLDGGAPLFRIVRTLERSRPAIISHESFSGDLLAPDYAGQRRESLAGLAALFPEARLLLFLREPAAWLASVYREYLHQGGSERFEHFAQRFAASGALEFAALAREVGALPFGRKLLIDFDDLASDFTGTVDRICGFAGVSPQGERLAPPLQANRGVRNMGARVLRRANPWLKSRFNRRGLPLTGVIASNFVGTPRRWIQRGPLAFLNRVGEDVVPRQALARIRDTWAANWAEARAAMSARGGD